MGRFLPGWIWEGESGPFNLAVREMRLPGEIDCLPAQRRGLVDALRLDGGEPVDPGQKLEMEQDGEGVSYTRRLPGDLSLEKTYHLEPHGVRVIYRLSNSGHDKRPVSLAVTSEVSLDYAAILRSGRKAFDFTTEGGYPAVVEPATGRGVRLESSLPWKRVIQREALLALEIGLEFDWILPAGTEETFELRLSAFPKGEV
jgi:hypothetical protein